jgi:hypothetical protein
VVPKAAAETVRYVQQLVYKRFCLVFLALLVKTLAYQLYYIKWLAAHAKLHDLAQAVYSCYDAARFRATASDAEDSFRGDVGETEGFCYFPCFVGKFGGLFVAHLKKKAGKDY